MARPLRLDQMDGLAVPEVIARCHMSLEDFTIFKAAAQATVVVSSTFRVEDVGRVPMRPDTGYPDPVSSCGLP